MLNFLNKICYEFLIISNAKSMYIYVLSQARTQTFEKGAASLRVFTKGCANH